MKGYLLLALIAYTVCQSLLGQCTMAPKRRPISCYEGKVLPEDMPELEQLLEEFKEGDDNVFALYLGDMFDKKEVREGREPNDEDNSQKLLGKCGVHPKYLPYECYEPQVLRRDRAELQDAFDKLHESDLDAFNQVLIKLKDKKIAYFYPEEE